jgi:ketosteroid isomerase-like protein
VPDRSGQIREFFGSFERDGIDAALQMTDPHIHWASPPEWMDQSGYEGHHGLRELDALWRENFEDFGLTLEEIRPAGDLYVVLLHQHGRIKGSGDIVRQKVGWIVAFGDDGLIVDVRAYFSWDQALEEAATLS